MLKQVTGCKDCPFRFEDEYSANPGTYCTAVATPEWVSEDSNYDPITPDWCPLKKEPITIFYKPEGNISATNGETVTIQITKDNFFNY